MDFNKYAEDMINKSAAKEKMIFRSFNHETYTIICNKNAMHDSNENDKELQVDEEIIS